MKKLSYLMIVAGMISFIACGPGKKELEENARQDSIAQAEKQKAFEDSVNAVLIEQARVQDSMMNAQAASSMKKAETTTKTSATKQPAATREAAEQEAKGDVKVEAKALPREKIKEMSQEQAKDAPPPAKQVRPGEVKPE